MGRKTLRAARNRQGKDGDFDRWGDFDSQKEHYKGKGRGNARAKSRGLHARRTKGEYQKSESSQRSDGRERHNTPARVYLPLIRQKTDTRLFWTPYEDKDEAKRLEERATLDGLELICPLCGERIEDKAFCLAPKDRQKEGFWAGLEASSPLGTILGGAAAQDETANKTFDNGEDDTLHNDSIENIKAQNGTYVHFDCALSQVEESLGLHKDNVSSSSSTAGTEKDPPPYEKVCYIGAGRFALLSFPNARDQKTFSIKRIIDYEGRGEGKETAPGNVGLPLPHTALQQKLSSLYSQT